MNIEQQMRIEADGLDNPVFVLLLDGEVYEVWANFKEAYEKYSSDSRISLAVQELRNNSS